MMLLIQKLVRNKTLMLLVLSIALLQSIFIDVRNLPTSPTDLRNRMVGSRIMMDGGSPYFYVWKPGDPERYYDYSVFLNSQLSNVTSTPFFHWVAGLVSNLPQHQLTVFWFILQYVSLGLCCLLAILALPPGDRWKAALLVAVMVFFTHTIGWRDHVWVGQNYIFPAVAAMGCYYCFRQKQDILHLLLFSFCAVSLVLLRPITALIFIPFLFYLKPYFKWLVSAAIVACVYIVFVLSSPLQKKNWEDYFSSVQLNILMHQGLLPEPKVKAVDYEADRFFPVMEGVDIRPLPSDAWGEKLFHGLENSNFFVMYNELTGKKVSIAAQTIVGLGLGIIILLPLFLVKRKKLDAPVEMLLLIGYMVYNAYEFCSPVTRGNYHFAQFIFPLLLLVNFEKKLHLLPILFWLAGIYLNVAVWPSVKMEHSIGQCMIVMATLYLAYRDLMMQYLKKANDKLRINDQVYWL